MAEAGLERAFLGSVTQQVVAASSVPVPLLRSGSQAMTKLEVVLVAVDGSPGGALGMASAVPLGGTMQPFTAPNSTYLAGRITFGKSACGLRGCQPPARR